MRKEFFPEIRLAKAGSILADIFTQHLLGSGLYQVVERGKIDQILRENNIDPTGIFAASNLDELRKILKVDGLIVGVDRCGTKGAINPTRQIK